MMTSIAVELLGGPLDGLQLSIPEAWPRLRFPLMSRNEAWTGALAPEQPVLTEEIVYERSTDKPGRYVWSYK